MVPELNERREGSGTKVSHATLENTHHVVKNH